MAIIGKNITIIVLAFCLLCCDKKQVDCSSDICTFEFVSLKTCISNSEDNSHFALDYFTSITADNMDTLVSAEQSKNLININRDSSCVNHVYANDSHQTLLKNKQKTIVFKGYKDSSLVVEENFEVLGGCCHVTYISGKQNISI